jgi:diguanylate cyclase (GGDEF)-like protein
MAARGNRKQERSPVDPDSDGADLPAAEDDIRILMVEDTPAEAELSMHYIRQAGIEFDCERVETEEALREALEDYQPDIVLSDFTLPRFDGLSALKVTREVSPDVPFIFVSGTIGEERAIDALKRGASDYVLKMNLNRLAPAITRALDDAAARSERKRQQAQIERLTRVLRMLSGVNAAVLRIRERDELFDEACRLAVTIGGYATAMVMLQQPGAGTVQAVACGGVEPASTEALRAAVLETADGDASIVGHVLKTGSAFVCSDTSALDAADRANALIMQMGFRAVIAMPLALDKTAIGVVLLTAGDTDALSDEELQMLREVAANLSFALQYLQKDSAVHFLSYFDPHTGLAKRALFCERLGRLLTRNSSSQCRRAVAVIDIEQLSVINDSFGRHMGDLLLEHVADRLRRQFHDTELLAQFGGGTFATALDSVLDPDPMAALQAKLSAVFAPPFEIEGRQIPVVVKSGVAFYPDDGADAAVLVQNAEAALHNARTSGKRHLHYSIEQHSEVVARLALEHRLRTAIEQQQFELHYQPIMNIETGRIASVEALVRWQHPESGLISPAAFLPLLESTGLISEVGDWVMARAARDCQAWATRALPMVRIAVNISPQELRRADFVARFLQLTEAWASASCGLDIEITEGALFEDCTDEVRKLKLLRGAGVRVAIDDFGTGYSSLSRLSELPIDTLKIDRSFVTRLPQDQSGETLVSTIITLAHAFGMSVVAEGVETSEQLAMLCKLGCDELQGYLLSKPLSCERFTELLEQGKGRLLSPVPGLRAAGDAAT